MKEFKIKLKEKEFTFRIREMNGIEALACRNVILQISEGKTEEAFYNMLEKYIDVQIDKDLWQRCKIGNNYYPKGLELNVNALEEIMANWMDYVSSFFSKSNA